MVNYSKSEIKEALAFDFLIMITGSFGLTLFRDDEAMPSFAIPMF